MLRLRSIISSAVRAKGMLNVQIPATAPIRRSHDHLGPPQPFDNLPFRVQSRYACTFVFAVLFGVGLWAPFLIVWYSMAKRTF